MANVMTMGNLSITTPDAFPLPEAKSALAKKAKELHNAWVERFDQLTNAAQQLTDAREAVRVAQAALDAEIHRAGVTGQVSKLVPGLRAKLTDAEHAANEQDWHQALSVIAQRVTEAHTAYQAFLNEHVTELHALLEAEAEELRAERIAQAQVAGELSARAYALANRSLTLASGVMRVITDEYGRRKVLNGFKQGEIPVQDVHALPILTAEQIAGEALSDAA
jgi:hypothetical protein